MNRILPATIAILLAAAPARATLVQFTGSWSTTLASQGFGGAPFTGTASFTFDTAPVSPGAGVQVFDGLPLSVLALSPNPFGATPMTTGNVFARLQYDSGVLSQLSIGVGESVVGVSGTTDDFSVLFFGPLTETMPADYELVSYSRAGFTSVSTEPGGAGFFSVVAIPEPSTLAAFGLVATTLAAGGRRRAR